MKRGEQGWAYSLGAKPDARAVRADSLQRVCRAGAALTCKRFATRLAPALAASLLVQGCVGIFFSGARTGFVENPVVSGTPSSYGMHAAAGGPGTTALSLRERWGNPPHVAPAGGSNGEFWTYQSGSIWYGVVPCVALPIPLALPLGKEKVIFLIRDGKVIKADLIKCDLVGGVGAGLFGPDGGPWAGAACPRN